MYFTLDDKPVLSPKVMRDECERLGYSTESWLGKANCFVDRAGAYPSYGYFLVDYDTIQTAQTIKDPSGSYVALTGSNKFTLKIGLSNGNEEIIEDMYVEEWFSITPSMEPENSYYLLKLVDARYVFQKYETSEYGLYTHESVYWWNKVITYLNPEQLKTEFILDTEPEHGEFIYDEDTIQDAFDTDAVHIKIGTRDGVDVNIPKALSWIEIFENFLLLFCDSSRSNIDPVFPYFEKNEYTLRLNFPEDTIPEWTPQDICLKYKTAADVLDQLLFWSGMTLVYSGRGLFTFRRAENKSTVYQDPDTKKQVDSSELEDYLRPYLPHKIIHDGITSAGNVIPYTFRYHFRLISDEREDNDKQEYHSEVWRVDELDPEGLPIEEKSVPIYSRNSINVVVPLTWADERKGLEEKIQFTHDEDKWDNFKLELHKVIDRYCHRLPGEEKEYSFYGFLPIGPRSFLDKVIWYDLGDGPVTRIDSIIQKDWDIYAPTPIIPREQKLSIIIAKVSEDVAADAITFEFKEPRLIIGQLFDENIAYNTLRRSYDADEEIILVGGAFQEWRRASLEVPENFEGRELYFTIDDVPYLRIKVNKSNLEEISGSAPYKWKVLIEDVNIVNGKLPKDKDDNTDDDYIYIKNSPEILMDDNDTFIYIAYDIQAGDDVYHRWTVADAQNDILFLKGLPGYVQNPEEPTEGERRLVLKSPYSSTQPIGWLEEAADGRTDEELEDFVIQIINEQGGTGGGGGGSTFILKGLINKAEGYASTDATVTWDGGIVLVSDGSVQPVSGTADNTFNTPFLDNEPVFLIKKNNGMWTALKIQENLIVATPNADVASNANTFNVTLDSTIQGTTPVGAITAKGNGFEYMSGEKLAFKHGNDNKWHVIERYDDTGIFRTTGTISGATYNSTSSTLTVGSGLASRFVCSPAFPSQYTLTGTYTIKNMTGSTIPPNRNIQAKKIGRYWFVDVEACG